MGKVYLIGAGPGDPGLITQRAKECIEQANVVIYDYLANEEFLSFARESAEIIYVGKKGGSHTLPQTKINELLVSKAKSSENVVRLKGGDPFIFGRGGEEAEELSDAGVQFEVIPGITSAISVPAYAGIPLTHRNFTTTVAFVTGHEDETKKKSSIAWDKIATGAGTLVFLMGVGNLSYIVSQLIAHGRPQDTPIAVIHRGTTSHQRTLVGNLANISTIAKKAKLMPPAIIVVGEVVTLREKLNWFEKKPLFGKKVLVTRSRHQVSKLKKLLEDFGAEVVQLPTIEIVPPKSFSALDNAINTIENYQWVIFTSENGVHYFMDRVFHLGKDVRELKGINIGAIGPATKNAVEKFHIRVDFMPTDYVAEGIIEEIKEPKGKKILIPRAKIARDILPDELRKLGALVDVVETYRTVKPNFSFKSVKDLVTSKKVDFITFTSSSTVTNFMDIVGKGRIQEVLDGVRVVSIGPITKETAEKFGIQTDIMPNEYTIPAMVEAIIQYVS